MHDDDVEAAAAECPDCCLKFRTALSSGVRYLLCPECGMVRMLPFAAWTAAIDRPVLRQQATAF